MAQKITALSAVLSLLIVTCCAQKIDLDNLINDLYHTGNINQLPQQLRPVKSALNPDCGYQKECVKRINCNNGRITTDGTGGIDIRFDVDRRDCGFLMVCCQTADIIIKATNEILSPELHDGNRNPDGMGYIH